MIYCTTFPRVQCFRADDSKALFTDCRRSCYAPGAQWPIPVQHHMTSRSLRQAQSRAVTPLAVASGWFLRNSPLYYYDVSRNGRAGLAFTIDWWWISSIFLEGEWVPKNVISKDFFYFFATLPISDEDYFHGGKLYLNVKS